jgi:FkbM family methyltransferase
MAQPPRLSRWENLTHKAYYWYRPQQVLQRIVLDLTQPGTVVTVRLPWGVSISCRRDEMIGNSILRTGVFELATTELILRLADAGELVIDGGANIGYMTSVLARAVSPGGRVVAYEPNPAVLDLLTHNVSSWRGRGGVEIQLRPVGLSDCVGEGRLELPREHEANHGTARVLSENAAATSEVRRIDLVKLDHEITSESVGLLKLDVEGHEEAALRGAEEILASGRVRDLVYEDFEPHPSDVSRWLEGHGFRIFDVVQSARGIRLSDPSRPRRASWDSPMLLATRAPQRAIERTEPRGWTALRTLRRVGAW